MKEPLGRGLGALLTDSSRGAAHNSDVHIMIRQKQRQVEILQEKMASKKREIEEEIMRLTVAVVLDRDPDKTEYFRMEASLDSMVKRRDSLIKEIALLRADLMPTTGAGPMGTGQDERIASSPGSTGISAPEDIDIRLIRELMPPQVTRPLEQTPMDRSHIEGLRMELDRGKKVEEVRREAYKARHESRLRSGRGGPSRPRKVKVLRGTARAISKRRDERMYDRVQVALEMLKNGDIAGSRHAMERILEDYPRDDEVLYHLGNTFFMDGDLREAFKLFKRSTEMNPRSSRAYNNLGVVSEKLGDKVSAIRAFNQALEIEPGYGRAWMNLGVLFLDLEPPMLREALIFLRRALELQPGLARARRKLEECQARMRPS
ncbi:MAG: tetratricopeptide repeat protein [Candidatus Thermoplasmatota archaeon]|nr:tetratricopeptide repeat protein [Candidatus Thermoplasmatota archaeon]